MSFISSEPLFQQLGYLTLNEQGAIISSGGELENDEKKGEVLYRMITMQQKLDSFGDEGCSVMSINFPEYSYMVCLSNRKIHIVKRRMDIRPEDESFAEVSVNNSINA